MASFRKKGRVSLWFGNDRLDPEIDILQELCGVDAYDLDRQECNLDDENWKLQSVGDLLKDLSYSSTFRDLALERLNEMGIKRALYALAQFDFAYDPKKVARTIADDPKFVGHFPWNDDEDDF